MFYRGQFSSRRFAHFYENDTFSSGTWVIFLRRIMTGGHISTSKNDPRSLFCGGHYSSLHRHTPGSLARHDVLYSACTIFGGIFYSLADWRPQGYCSKAYHPSSFLEVSFLKSILHTLCYRSCMTRQWVDSYHSNTCIVYHCMSRLYLDHHQPLLWELSLYQAPKNTRI